MKGRATTYCAGSRQGKLLIGRVVAAVATGTLDWNAHVKDS